MNWRLFWQRSTMGIRRLIFLRTSEGPSMDGINLRSLPVECPSSYALMRMRNLICGWRSSASVMVCVPLPPENRTTLIRVRASFCCVKSSGTEAPQERFDLPGVCRGVNSHCFFHFHQMRRQNPVPLAHRKWDGGQEVEFACAGAPRFWFISKLGEKAAKDFRAGTEETGVAFSFFRHCIPFPGLEQPRDIALAIPSPEVNVGPGTSTVGMARSEVDPIGWTKNRPFLDGAAG